MEKSGETPNEVKKNNEPTVPVEASTERNKQKHISELVSSRLKDFAEKFGGEYIEAIEEETQERDALLDPNPELSQDERGYLWASDVGYTMANNPNVKRYNESGLHGFIVNREPSPEEETVRLYRGARYDGGEQTAPLCRVDGIEVEDVVRYMQDPEFRIMDVINKATDPTDKTRLVNNLKFARVPTEGSKEDEMTAVERMHKAFSSGATGLGIRVACTTIPEGTYRSESSGNAYGDFIRPNGEKLDCVMVLDVPKDKVKTFGDDEAGVLGEIQKGWIRAIVPTTTDNERLMQSIQKAERYIDTNPVTPQGIEP